MINLKPLISGILQLSERPVAGYMSKMLLEIVSHTLELIEEQISITLRSWMNCHILLCEPLVSNQSSYYKSHDNILMLTWTNLIQSKTVSILKK